MSILTFDLETTAIDNERVDKIHCMGYQWGEGDPLLTTDIATMGNELAKSKIVIGHNIIGFDIPVVEDHIGEVVPSTRIDTLIMSKAMFTDMWEVDSSSKWRRTLGKYGITQAPKGLKGMHSLEAWGHRLGVYKGDYGKQEEAWEEYSEEMGDYCKQDVNLTYVLYAKLMEVADDLLPIQVLNRELNLAKAFQVQKEVGIKLDLDHAYECVDVLDKEYAEVLQQPTLDCRFKAGEVRKYGNARKECLEWEGKAGIWYTPIEWVNLTSRKQIGELLVERGWKPKEFSDKTELPKVDEDTIGDLDDPLAKQAIRLMMLDKRRSALSGTNGWLNLQRAGRIHHKCHPTGTVSSRVSHTKPNFSQIPSSGKEYGTLLRKCFIADEGYCIYDVDIDGLELGIFAHYVEPYDNGLYRKAVEEGDKSIGTDAHSLNMKAMGLDCRQTAKVAGLALLYGASAKGLDDILKCGLPRAKKLREEFTSNTKGLVELREHMADEVKNNKGLIPLIDGRKVYSRSEHSVLNLLLQGSGAAVAKLWYLNVYNTIKRMEGINLMTFVHDQITLQFKEEEYSKSDIEGICLGNWHKAREDIGLNPVFGLEGNFGYSFGEIH